MRRAGSPAWLRSRWYWSQSTPCGWLFVAIAATPAVSCQHGQLSPARAYLSLFALTAINPATVITFAAVVIGRSQIGSSWLAVALFALGAFLASAMWQLMLAGGGSLLGRLLRGRRGQLGISLCSALIMLGAERGCAAELTRAFAEELFGGGEQHTGGKPVDGSRHLLW